MLKSIIIFLHKWLGILSGIVVVIISVTGCIYVFQEELKLYFYSERYIIQHPTASVRHMPVSTLFEIAQKELGSTAKISRLDLYPAKDRTWIFRATKNDNEAFGHWNYQTYYKRVFVNPYSGEVQAVENTKYEFFNLVLQAHLNLLLGKKIGHPVVGISTIIFVLLLISGIILWWPKKWKKKTLNKAFKLSFAVKWKRLVYDLHQVLGFYSFLFALVIAVTGLVFAYSGFKEVYIKTIDLFDRQAAHHIDKEFPKVQLFSLDEALDYTLSRHGDADMMSLRMRGDDGKQDIQIRLQKNKTSDFIWYYFDLTNGQIENIKMDDTNSVGNQAAALNYDLHTGGIGGIGLKIIYFVLSLICASLPITGYLIWLNKRRKKEAK